MINRPVLVLNFYKGCKEFEDLKSPHPRAIVGDLRAIRERNDLTHPPGEVHCSAVSRRNRGPFKSPLPRGEGHARRNRTRDRSARVWCAAANCTLRNNWYSPGSENETASVRCRMSGSGPRNSGRPAVTGTGRELSDLMNTYTWARQAPLRWLRSHCREAQRTHVHTCSEVRCLSNVTSPRIDRARRFITRPRTRNGPLARSRPVPLLRALNAFLVQRMQEAEIDLGRINGNRIRNCNRDWRDRGSWIKNV